MNSKILQYYSAICILVLASAVSQLKGQDLFATQEVEEIPPAPILQNLDSREIRNLNGTWNALIEPTIFSLNDLFHFAERDYKAGPGELVEVDLDNGLELEVPGDWNTQDDRLFFYQGKVWYKRNLELGKSESSRYYLHFGAINYRAEVYVNGKLAATHSGGYTSFNCEVTDLLIDGQNTLVVKVDNTLASDEIPTQRTDWLNYGGITRDVHLVTLPRSFIENYKIQLQRDNPKLIQAAVKINGAESGTARLVIEELDIQEDIVLNDGAGEVEIPANPQLWSPDSPKLYDVTLIYNQEVLKDKIGFRTVKVDDGQISVNGKSIFLRGISLHEEAIGEKGRASSYEEALELLGYAKELNCNFVRLAHYTHNRHMLKAADEMGLLVWAEIPVYWNLEFANPEVMDKARSRMSEMITRDHNRASIVFWSLGNETPVSKERNEFFAALNSYVKELDDTRLTTAALVFGAEEIQEMAKAYFFPTMQGKEFDSWDIHIADSLAQIVDVAAINQYFGWYYSGFLAMAAKLDPLKARQVMLENMTKVKFHVPNNKPFVFSEFGAGAKYGMKDEEQGLTVFSETYQAQVYEKQIQLIKNQSGLVGTTPWILKDFRSPMRLKQGTQDYWNLKGLITDKGERKQAYFVLKDFYKELSDQ